jgi:hypothetical protein
VFNARDQGARAGRREAYSQYAAAPARRRATPISGVQHGYRFGSLKRQRSVTVSPSKVVDTLYGRLVNSRIMPWFWAEV